MITMKEYKARRQKLAQKLPQGSIAICLSAKEQLRNGDVHYRFRQASNFYYLTGFNEPDAVLLILAGQEGESYLFNNPENLAIEQWTGKRLGQEGARHILGMQEAYPIEELEKRLPDFLANKAAVYYSLGEERQFDKTIISAIQTVKDQIRRGISAPGSLCDIEPILGEMRLFKSEQEIQLMRQAASISVEAHLRAMRAVKAAKWEYQIEAELLYEFTRQGCHATAYDPIVAAGKNACVLHYTANNQALNPGDLLLIDAGGELANYAADITRTFPINGRFSGPQAKLYNLVLKAQKAGIACIKPGVPFAQIQETIVSILTEGLCELGILQGKTETLIANGAYKPFYMHNSGHWLGLDVHDAGVYRLANKSRPLEAGMVLTVEPGLYMTAGLPGLDKIWENIGIRIEDDILVTEQGHENLSQALPVEIKDIEAYLGG
jgi:Xaa-Pro aminopeptidase